MLRPEYQKILDSYFADENYLIRGNDFIQAITRCQALADQSPKELSDSEIRIIWYSVPVVADIASFGRAIIAAHKAKQLEQTKPVTMKLKLVDAGNGNFFAVPPNTPIGSHQRWASDEFDSGPIQP